MKCKIVGDEQYVGGHVGLHRNNSASYTTASWRYYYPRCSKVLQSLGICSSSAGAWVAAITVCNQRLF